MKWTITMIIPCDSPYKLIDEADIGKKKILKENRLLSPIVGFCSYDSNALVDNYTRDLFDICGINDPIYTKLRFGSFEIVEVFHPYGIVLQGRNINFDITDIKSWIEEFDNHFDLRSVGKTDDNKNHKWEIKEYPIIIFKSDFMNSEQIERLKTRLELYNEDNPILKRNCIFLQDPIILLPQATKISESVNNDLLDVLKVVCAIKMTGREIRMNLAKIIKQSKKEPPIISRATINDLFELNKKCALVNELYSNTIFRTYQQKILYDLVKERFSVHDIMGQISGAANLINTILEQQENVLSSKMNKTLFITGYICTILAIFNFFPLSIKNLFWIDISDNMGFLRWLIYGDIVVSSVCICAIFVRIYDHIIGNEKRKKHLLIAFTMIGIVLFIILVPFILPIVRMK